jgi:hypothetical protein
LEIHVSNVLKMLMSVYRILAELMPDVLISLELINVNANPDAKAIPRQDVLVLLSRLTGANSNSVVPMLNADLKTELENATVHLNILMAIQIKVVQADPEKKNVNLTLTVPLTNPVSEANVKTHAP